MEKDLETSCKVMILKNTAITVTNSERMLRADYKLVGIAWMLVVMDQTGNEGSKIVMSFQTLFDIALLQ